MAGDAAHEVRLGSVFAAIWRGIAVAPTVFVAAWAVRFGLDMAPQVARGQAGLASAGGLGIQLLAWTVGALVALLSGLLIRWLLAPRRESLRADLALAAYVAVILASRVPSVLEARLLIPLRAAGSSVSEMLLLTNLFLVASFAWLLILAALALWPVALLARDRMSPAAALRLMGPAYVPWVATNILLMAPGLIFTQGLVWGSRAAHRVPLGLGERALETAVSALAGTAALYGLAYVYARRVRGSDLPAAGRGPLSAEPA